MSATLEESAPVAGAQESLSEGNATVPAPFERPTIVTDSVPRWLKASAGMTWMLALSGSLLVYLAGRPLWPTDLWDHLNYGARILQTGTVPDTEPLMSVSAGMRMVNTAWLSQVGMELLNRRWGLTALQFSAALLAAGSLFLVSRLAMLRGQSVIAGVLAGLVFVRLNLHELQVIRPQLAGLLLYCAVLNHGLQPPRSGRWQFLIWPVLFGLWANLHGSFVLGLLVLAVSVAGRFGDVLFRSRSLPVTLGDPEAWRGLLLLQLCAVAVLANPAGLLVYPEVLQFSANLNVESMFEWAPLTLRSVQGQWYAAAVLLTMLALKISPRRIRCGEVLLLVVTGMLAAWSVRMLNWFAPVAGVVAGVHLVAGVRGLRARVQVQEPSEPAVIWSLANAGLLWIVVAITPFGTQLLRGVVPEESRLLSPATPIRTVEFLRGYQAIPRGLAFVPAEWSGYVMNRGPQSLRPLVNLHVHLMPEEVWKDYLRLIRGPADWQTLMDEYGMNMAIVNKAEQPVLVKKIRESADWKAEYEDRQGIVFVRKRPV